MPGCRHSGVFVRRWTARCEPCEVRGVYSPIDGVGLARSVSAVALAALRRDEGLKETTVLSLYWTAET